MEQNIKISDAVWEKRNLGFSVYEVTVNEYAKITELDSVLSLDSDLLYVKVHHNNFHVIKKLLSENFVYIENQFIIQKRLRKVVVPELFTKTLRSLETQVISSKKEFEIIFDELDKGLFTSDRFAKDENFGIKVSNLRYKNWISDMIRSGDYECNLIKTKDEKIPVAFFINKYQLKIAHAMLGGVFNDFKGIGVGHSFIYFAMKNAIKQNCKVLKTQISSNNLPVFNIYSSIFGFEINGNYVVLKKINLNAK